MKLLRTGIGLLLARIALAQIGGTWVFTSQIPVGTDIARVELEQRSDSLNGKYFGLLGQKRTISGTRNGNQISLTIDGEWPTDGSPIQATLTGILTASSGSGSLAVGGTIAGVWTAVRIEDDEDFEQRAAVTVDYRTQKPGRSSTITPEDLPDSGIPYTFGSPAKLIPRPANAWPQVPKGFTVSLYADGFHYPRKILTAPNGDVFLIESRLGQVKVLRGITSSGRASTISVFASGLNQPFGIAFYPPGDNPRFVYVANTDSVVRFPYINGDLVARGQSEVIIPDLPSGAGGLVAGGHWTRDLTFSNDGRALYVSVGSWSNVDDTDNNPREVRRADILEYSPEGQFARIYSSGIRNPVGIAVDPNTGRLWCTNSERDLSGNDLVPDFIARLEPAGFYGWPWFYIGNNWDPRHQGKHPELADTVRIPDVLLQAHSAPMTLAFYQGRQFPEQYRNDIFAALHGSWNRHLRTGYTVVRIRLESGTARGSYEDFLTGFVTNKGEVWGRPVGVTVAQDGSLLVSDDGSGSVWRVTYSER